MYLMYYKQITDIGMMMLVGYGFLVSYLRFHRWHSLSLTFFSSMFVCQYYILLAGFW